MSEMQGLGWRPSPEDLRDWTPQTLKAMVSLGVARPVTWYIPPGLYLYQENKPYCVAYSGGYLITAAGSQSPVTIGVDNDYCDQLYTDIKAIEGVYPGDPDFNEGSCLRSLGKELRRRGIIDGYSLTRDFASANDWVDHYGCVVLGTFWWTGMFKPDAVGRVKPTGSKAGGHAYCWYGKDLTYDNGFVQTWGQTWGVDGKFFMDDLDTGGLIADSGEALLTIKLAAGYTPAPPVPKTTLCHFGRSMRRMVKHG